MKPTHALSSTAVLVTLLAMGRAASAQDVLPEVAPPPPPPVMYTQPAPSPPPGAAVMDAPGPPPPPPPPVYTQPAPYPPPGAADMDAPRQPPPAYDVPGQAPPPPPDHARSRYGIEAGSGYTLASSKLGEATGAAFNVGLRLGVQIRDPWAVYFQSSLHLGYATDTASEGKGVSGEAVSWSNGVLAEYSLGDFLHFGLGPSFDMVSGRFCANSSDLGNGTTMKPNTMPICSGTGGSAFGVTGRIAATFVFSQTTETFFFSETTRRKALSLGLDLHPMFTRSGTFVFATLNVGYEVF